MSALPNAPVICSSSNDEAHHTHDEDSEWNKSFAGCIRKRQLTAQLDFSATPRFQKARFSRGLSPTIR